MNKLALLAFITIVPLIGVVLANPPERPRSQEFGAATIDQPNADRSPEQAELKRHDMNHPAEITMQVQYLEIVTPSVDETCNALAKAHGVTFSPPVAALGNARTAKLKGGGQIGVRAPLRATEQPVVRPYILVQDIHAAVQAAVEAGGQMAMLPTEIPGQGTFAIYVLGGIDHGLWQLGKSQP